MRWLILLVSLHLSAQTIEEKRSTLVELDGEMIPGLEEVNRELLDAFEELRALHRYSAERASEGATESELRGLLHEIQRLRREVAWVEESWRRAAPREEEPYALWHQPWTTVEQLVMEYGAQDHLYLIPKEVGEMRIGLSSDLPIPRSAWGELLALILTENGVGINERGGFLRELYLATSHPTRAEMVTDERSALATLDPTSRVCFVLEATRCDVGYLYASLDKFADAKETAMHLVGRQIFIFAPVRALQQLLQLSDFVTAGSRTYEQLALRNVTAEEMERMLDIHFHDAVGGGRIYVHKLAGRIFLTGEPDDVERAAQLARQLDAEMADPQRIVTTTYQSHHSDAAELADILRSTYSMLTGDAGDHFSVDPKTGTLIMVVEEGWLPQLQNLLTQLDVPKKMVRIEVLLFEKKITSSSRFGLDLLRLGSGASGVRKNSINFSSGGLAQFIFSGITPKFDLLYDFLLTQEDIRINANPSVTTVNQVPARIELVEEVSIDTGSTKNDKSVYTRAQFGITIQITPIVNAWVDDLGDTQHTIALQTDVQFDTPRPSKDHRPPVIRRHITNEVRVADGETVILGGLRSKTLEDGATKLPFLGELPGIGKIFSNTSATDRDTEMFIFITPTIIEDPAEELARLRRTEMQRRPGDLPEFMDSLLEARKQERQRLFSQSLGTLFGRGS